MIKEIQNLLDKYKEIGQKSEYVSVGDVINDLYYLQQDCRLKRIPREDR